MSYYIDVIYILCHIILIDDSLEINSIVEEVNNDSMFIV